MQFENLPEGTLARYEKFFFEEICKIPTGDRQSFSIPLRECEGLHFACVQDTVERLIEEGGTGRLSKFQWRNFIFAPVDKNVSVKDVYERVFDELRRTLPSIFIRSYVYLVFIRVYGSGALSLGGLLGDDARQPVAKDFRTYQWNTKYDIVRTSPYDLSEIGRPRQKNQSDEGSESSATEEREELQVERVFIVSDPLAELKRIQDANSDVIDAVKAFTGNLGLVKQTADMLQGVEKALEKPGSRVLLEGPARSGKTIIAMSLLASDPSAKMLLMNWYFYDALRDAFKIWAKQDENEIARLFEPSQKLRKTIARHEADLEILRVAEKEPRILPALIELWRNPPEFPELARWTLSTPTDGKQEWLLSNIGKRTAGDIVCVWQQSKKVIQLQVIGEILDDGLAKAGRLFETRTFYNERPLKIDLNASIREGSDGKWADIPDHLEELYNLTEGESVANAIAHTIKAISKALEDSEQRFFHHDRNYSAGLWLDRNRKLISDYGTLVCDEAQRLGKYGDLDECEWVRHRPGRTFLCGDDNQRLNRRGDRGITPILEGVQFDEFHLPESVGIPPEIGILVKAMLNEAEIPKAPKSFSIKLLYRDDLGLVSAFNRDPSGKKHYAIPMSTGFYKRDYVPCIMRSTQPTDKCTSECEKEDLKGFCVHRYIRALSPISDPEWMRERKDLSRSYKFFCAEAIMPNYALSAYELISREVESVYLKIPWQINLNTLQAPLDGDEKDTWIKRHLYVLMTRATANLVINVEDKGLYEFFKKTCEEAGMDCQVE